jgi:hypothetical protein
MIANYEKFDIDGQQFDQYQQSNEGLNRSTKQRKLIQ